MNGIPHIQNSSKDIQQIMELLAMFGIKSYDENVPHILLEFIYNSISKNIEDSVNIMTLMETKNNIDDIPMKLLQYTSKRNYKQKNRIKAFNNAMALKKNKQALPIPAEHNPLKYPSEDDCFISSSNVYVELESDDKNLKTNLQSQNTPNLLPALKLIPSNNSHNSHI